MWEFRNKRKRLYCRITQISFKLTQNMLNLASHLKKIVFLVRLIISWRQSLFFQFVQSGFFFLCKSLAKHEKLEVKRNRPNMYIKILAGCKDFSRFCLSLVLTINKECQIVQINCWNCFVLPFYSSGLQPVRKSMQTLPDLDN